jgi:hypothetical protein
MAFLNMLLIQSRYDGYGGWFLPCRAFNKFANYCDFDFRLLRQIHDDTTKKGHRYKYFYRRHDNSTEDLVFMPIEISPFRQNIYCVFVPTNVEGEDSICDHVNVSFCRCFGLLIAEWQKTTTIYRSLFADF